MPNPTYNPLAFVARVIFALPFLAFGMMHLLSTEAMAGAVPLPAGAFWVGLTGLCMIAAAISLLLDRVVWLSMPALALMLAIFTLALHVPEALAPETAQSGLIAILKNIGLIGGALAFTALYPPGRRPR